MLKSLRSTVAEASMSKWLLSIQEFYVPLHIIYVDYDVLLCESKLSESIVVVTDMEGMASVHSVGPQKRSKPQ